jgi:MerR family mercuric resistance operon transcriptional regulator
MRIGEVAARAEVNVQTVRFYEREGLLRKPARTPGGYRSYESHDLELVKFIRVCQGLGFTLREVKQLIRLHRVNPPTGHASPTSPQSIREIVSIAEERIASIEEKMCTLARMRGELRKVIEALSAHPPLSCPAGPESRCGRKPEVRNCS